MVPGHWRSEGVSQPIQIATVELGQLIEPRFVENSHASAFKFHDPILAQLLDDAIGVHRRDPQRLSDLLLRERHVEAFPLPPADLLETLPKLNHDMCKTGRRG